MQMLLVEGQDLPRGSVPLDRQLHESQEFDIFVVPLRSNWGFSHEQPVKKTFLRLGSRRSSSCEFARDPHQQGICWCPYPRARKLPFPPNDNFGTYEPTISA